MTTLVETHDCVLLDLDGTVYRGPSVTDGAVEALRGAPVRALFVTNNASTSPAQVALRLRRFGVAATSRDVVTSAQSAARLLSQQLPNGARVLVVGTEALAAEIHAVGLTPVQIFGDSPAAVVQGHSPATGWPELCEAAFAISAGALWVATNMDKALPSEGGLVPGNGSMVAALTSATGRVPQVAGKPTATIIADALARGKFCAPLVVGDRLDTDVAGAHATGLPSLLVLTGVTTVRDVVTAGPGQRPTYLARDLRGLHESAEDLAVLEQAAWRVDVCRGTLTVTSTGVDPGADGLSVIRAIAHAVWHSAESDATICPGDDAAWVALHRWALLPEAQSDSARRRSASR